MNLALPGALALACLAGVALAGCAELDAVAPALEAVACDAVESTAPAETLCVGLAGDVVTLGENIAAKPAAAKATALALPAPAPAAAERHGK